MKTKVLGIISFFLLAIIILDLIGFPIITSHLRFLVLIIFIATILFYFICKFIDIKQKKLSTNPVRDSYKKLVEESYNEGLEFKIGEEIKLGKDFIMLNQYSLTIYRKGPLNLLIHGLKGKKDIYYKNITSIQIKPAGKLSGYMQFELMGSFSSKGGLVSAMGDENTIVLYTEKHNQISAQIKDYIESITFKEKSITNQSNNLSDIRELKKLLDEGLITEEEFNKKKASILSV